MWSYHSKSLQTRANSIDLEKEIIKNKLVMEEHYTKSSWENSVSVLLFLWFLESTQYNSNIEINSYHHDDTYWLIHCLIDWLSVGSLVANDRLNF